MHSATLPPLREQKPRADLHGNCGVWHRTIDPLLQAGLIASGEQMVCQNLVHRYIGDRRIEPSFVFRDEQREGPGLLHSDKMMFSVALHSHGCCWHERSPFADGRVLSK